MIRKIFLSFLTATCCATSFAKDLNIDSLWARYQGLEASAEGIPILLSIAKECSSKGDRQTSDSLYALLVDQADITGNDTLCMEVYTQYFNSSELSSNEISREYLSRMLSLATKYNNDHWLYEAYKSRYRMAEQEDKPQEALKQIDLAFYYANQTDDDTIKTDCLLFKGYALELNNDKIGAFRHYMKAGFLSEKIKQPGLTSKCNEKLSAFYYRIHNYEKAREYKKRQLQVMLSVLPVDSVGLMKLNMGLAAIYTFDNKPAQAEKIGISVLDFAIRNKNEELKNDAFTIYRSCLIDKEQLVALADLYTKRYPAELARIRQKDTTLYYRLQAYIHEAYNKPDSALAFYNLAEKELSRKPVGGYQMSNFYKRFGQFLLRNGNAKLAEVKFHTAYQHAAEMDYLPFMIETAHLLDSVNFLLKKTDTAYYYTRLFNQLSNRLSELNSKEEVLRLEIDTEIKKQELEKKQAEEQTRRRHNLQYMGMTVCIILSFIVLAMLGSFKVHKFMIRAMGFFSFIFFFEFLILLADHQIHDITHGEPWKIMAIKIVFIAMLLPLHHWMEEKVVHYLSNHRLIDTSKISIRKLFRRPAPVAKVIPSPVVQKEKKEQD